jgi:gliding motility-associated-like protein
VDEIEIYKDCEYPVYMPGAFTPGNDGLNDHYGYPPQNKNRLTGLEIYNRWGQRVFFTTEKTKGWDGKIRGVEQPSGVYLYLLRLKTLDGKEVVRRGSFVLIRR